MLRHVLLTLLLSTPTAFAQSTFSAMTFNIHHGESVAGKLELAAIAELIRAQQPDVVALQEVDNHFSERSEFRDQSADLAAMLDMNHCFGANLDSASETPGQPRSQYGTALLSPHPLKNCRNTLLPRQGEDEQRSLLSATLIFADKTLSVYNTHLQHDSAEARRQQADAIVAALPAAPEKTLLMGDFNARAAAPEIKALTDLLPDSWTQGGQGAGFTYPAEAPEHRIDYVLASSDVRAVRVNVLKTQASDHRPIIAVFSFE